MSENSAQHFQGVDVVVPFYNEASVLADLCREFAGQKDANGHLLSSDSWRVIAVNNASTDDSAGIIQSFRGQPGMPETIILDEPQKGVVQARRTGTDYALADARHPFVLHIDADNRLPETLIADVSRRLSSGRADVLAYAGHFSLDFWQRVPRLAQRYYESTGVLEFCAETRRHFGFDEARALFTRQLFEDFVRVPNQLGLAMTKASLQQCGGYFREYDAQGNEILGEARNIWFRLDMHDARLDYVDDLIVTLNPRRLLGDPERWCSGQSYAGGMTDLRDIDSEDNYALLNRLAEKVEFAPVRRNMIKRFIIEPCVVKPQRIKANSGYFTSIEADFHQQIVRWRERHPLRQYADALPLVLDLTEQYSSTILNNMRYLRGLNG